MSYLKFMVPFLEHLLIIHTYSFTITHTPGYNCKIVCGTLKRLRVPHLGNVLPEHHGSSAVAVSPRASWDGRQVLFCTSNDIWWEDILRLCVVHQLHRR